MCAAAHARDTADPAPATGPSGAAVPLLRLPGLDPALVDAAVTTRAGGVSVGACAGLNLALHVGDDPAAVAENRARAAAAFGADLGRFVFARQIAGAEVAHVGAADAGRGARTVTDAVDGTDALVTTEPDLVLVAMSADCVPIVLHDPAAGALAVVHAGWRGLACGVIPAAVQAISDLGGAAENVMGSIGPAIAAALYRVGDDVADAVRTAFGREARAVLRPDGSGKYLFDLVGTARLQLIAAGLAEASVHWCGQTTGPSTPFYSHRLEGPTGRFATLARLREK